MPRREAFQAAVDAGAAPTGSVSNRTDYLVVGTIDLRRVGEMGLSSKHRKALDLIAEGSQIQVIDEDQFVCLLAGTITRDSPDPTPEGPGPPPHHDPRSSKLTARNPGQTTDRAVHGADQEVHQRSRGLVVWVSLTALEVFGFGRTGVSSPTGG